MMSPLPLISRTYSLLQQDESQRKIPPTRSNFSGDTAAFITPNHSTYNPLYHSTSRTIPPKGYFSTQNSNRSFSQKVIFYSKRRSSGGFIHQGQVEVLFIKDPLILLLICFSSIVRKPITMQTNVTNYLVIPLIINSISPGNQFLVFSLLLLHLRFHTYLLLFLHMNSNLHLFYMGLIQSNMSTLKSFSTRLRFLLDLTLGLLIQRTQVLHFLQWILLLQALQVCSLLML